MDCTEETLNQSEVHLPEVLLNSNKSTDTRTHPSYAVNSNAQNENLSNFKAAPRQPLNEVISSSESEDSNDSDDDDDDALRWKRRKVSKKHKKELVSNSRDCQAFTACAEKFAEDRKKAQVPANKFNVWSNVLAEQGLVEDLNFVGAEHLKNSDRGCEGYNYSLKNEYQGHVPIWQKDSREIHRRLGCKRSAKERLGELSTLKKDKRTFSISENDTDEVVVSGIATILREPKLDLIARTVKTVGKKKALELLAMTEDIEECGGMMTVDGSRRRTPGGVFLLLLRNDFYTRKEDLDIIFEEDRKKQTMVKKDIIRAKRRKAAQAQGKPKESCPLAELPTLPELLLKEKQLKDQIIAAENVDKEPMDVNNEELSDSEKEAGEIDSD